MGAAQVSVDELRAVLRRAEEKLGVRRGAAEG